MEQHFSALAELRTASSLPIFALEHGLSETELCQITKLLHAGLVEGLRLAPHWLLWTIYAAERGYTYDGGEYWKSFEERTPGWNSSDRYSIRKWFLKFQKAYNGVVPTGPWADHFGIIAWPITHAILPRYLQRQFARTLYDLRFKLAQLNSFEPADIGRQIAANSYNKTTRFEQFLQQEELVGRIVLSLLHQDLREGEEPLLPATLNRIVVDLKRIRHAHGWLKQTGRAVTHQFKGLGRDSGLRQFTAGPNAGNRPDKVPRPDIRPDLVLRYAGDNRWTLVIDIPNFKEIATLSAEVRHFLKQTRCVLNGGPGKKPAGWVLSGKRRAVLKDWPDPDKPLVEFEKKHDTVDHILESECRMSNGPVWLFRIRLDGTAREITGRIVRPGYDYILVSRKRIDDLLDSMHSCTIDCNGVNAIRISVPAGVPTVYINWLQNRGLELARTIRVWPAGLPGRNWDGEGRSDWLSTEKPCLGIMPDHPVDSYLLTLDSDSSTIVQAPVTGQPTFIQLPYLEVGTHVLTVKAQHGATLQGAETTLAHEGYLELRVREPELWMPGTTSQTCLVVISDPHDATLGTFWENEFDLTVFGPLNRQVTLFVSLENPMGEEIYREQVCAPIDLPIMPSTWRKCFEDFLKRERCEWRYLEASSGVLTLDGQELGRYLLRFDQEVLPIRWIPSHAHNETSIRLIDETGQENIPPRCHFLSMEKPTKPEPLSIENALAGINVDPPGGLFVVRGGKFRDAVVLSAGLTGHGLRDLGVIPDTSDVHDDTTTIIKLLEILHHWCGARIAGSLANARRSQVVDSLLIAIYSALAGANWGQAETSFKNSTNIKQETHELQTLIAHRDRFSVVLRDHIPSVHGDISEISDWFTNLMQRYDVSDDPTLCGFAIQLASRPHRLPSLYRDKLESLLERTKKRPLLIRSARFVALLCANHDSPPDSPPYALLPRRRT